MVTRFNPVILIPSYNSGVRLKPTVEKALDSGVPVCVVVDGSTDGSDQTLAALENRQTLQVIRNPHNQGKGAAIASVLTLLQKAKFTHVLTMDSDGQHPASEIPRFLDKSEKFPKALVMGAPKFGDDAPAIRCVGRQLTLWWTNLETLWIGLGDSLFGMRVYPLNPLIRAFGQTSFARGFDFDPEIAVRMVWQGCLPVQVPVQVRYFSKDEGGVSHFNYLRDNLRLTILHFRLIPEFMLFRLNKMIKLKKQRL